MSRAVAMIVRSGRSSRPASSQPNTTDSTAITARPNTELNSSERKSVLCWATAVTLPGAPTWLTCITSLMLSSGMSSTAVPEAKNRAA